MKQYFKLPLLAGAILCTTIACQPDKKRTEIKDDTLAFFAKEKKEKTAQFQTLNLGEVKPLGWLGAQLKRDLKHGYVSNYDEVSPVEMQKDIYGADRVDYIPDSLYTHPKTWLKGMHWWVGEQ